MALRMHPNEPSAASTLTAMALYLIITMAVFDSPFLPVWFITLEPDKLDAPGWLLLVMASIGFSFIVSFVKPPSSLNRFWRLPVFTVLTLVLSITSVCIYVERIRTREMARFDYDLEEHQSFFRSLGNFQYDYKDIMHGTAIKDCVPYGWSYSEMKYYKIPPLAAPNVINWKWREKCPIIDQQWETAKRR